MGNLVKKFEPIDCVAIILILGGLGLMYLHINGIVGGLLVSITGYYFGKQQRPPENPKI